jgi:hypothetical protein
MRMFHYFLTAALLASVALIAAAATGFAFQVGRLGGEVHLQVGLIAAILVLGTHTLVIVFSIVTGRILREAMLARDLGPAFLIELNEFFAKKAAYPAAIFGALSVVVTGVLGTAQHYYGLPSTVHVGLGVGAIALNLWALRIEGQAMLANKSLIDRAADELDRIDRETPAEELRAREEEALEIGPGEASRRWLLIGVSVWAPYFYWVLIPWRGDFSKVSLHPWVELSIGALVAAFLTRPPRADVNEQPAAEDRA